MSKICSIITFAKETRCGLLTIQNFRPISNLKVLSKIIEKSVAFQLNNYLKNNNLHETFQSAYEVHPSTETAMVKVQDDILYAMDSNRAVVLLMLDLSAAFDTVSHAILRTEWVVSRLWHYGFCTGMVCILPVVSFTICSD